VQTATTAQSVTSFAVCASSEKVTIAAVVLPPAHKLSTVNILPALPAAPDFIFTTIEVSQSDLQISEPLNDRVPLAAFAKLAESRRIES